MSEKKTRILVYYEFNKDPESWSQEDIRQAVYPRVLPHNMRIFQNLAAVDDARGRGEIRIPKSYLVRPDLKALGYEEGDPIPVSCPHCGNTDIGMIEEIDCILGTLILADPVCQDGTLRFETPNGTVMDWDSSELCPGAEYACRACNNDFSNFNIPKKGE